MLSKTSIKQNFALQLVVASAALIVIFSVLLYNYIKISIYEDISNELLKEAEYVKKNFSPTKKMRSGLFYSLGKNQVGNMKISVTIRTNKGKKYFFEQNIIGNKIYLILYYPFNKKRSSFIRISKDISDTEKLFGRILKSIALINMVIIVFIIFYAFFLTQNLLNPITVITDKLAKMNENFLQHIDIETLPDEFMPLGKSINKLIDRILNFIKYQKELFIGTAHELKTPLAVMKTKNEVTLLRKREPQKYIDVLRLNNQTIDEMNKMISNILEIGRQEGAQFEQPVKMDIIEFLRERANNFKMLARQEDKDIITNFKPKKYCLLIQKTLLIHILQNFVQNAIKFTPKGKKITIKSFSINNGLMIEVIDEGIGIDENQDLFAPFKRFGNKSGAGLGLFLAKSAADAIGATLTLENRKDGKSGAVAKLFIPTSSLCPLHEETFNNKKL